MELSDSGIGDKLKAGLKSFGLTARELQILRLLALGQADRQISIALNISVKTVNHHVSSIILKLDACNRTHAVAKAMILSQLQFRSADYPVQTLFRRTSDQFGTES